MELSVTLDYFLTKLETGEPRPIEEAAALCKAAGFDYVDYSSRYTEDDWEEIAHRDREALDAAGIRVEQTHAPFNRYDAYPADKFAEYYDRLFKVSKILGAKFVVCHADEYRVTDRYDPQEIEDFAYDYLAPHVEYAAKNGMTVAIENLFEDHAKTAAIIDGKSRFTSRVEELKGIVERFNTPSVRVCWDFGHGHCAYGSKMTEALKEVLPLLVCTHTHDNYYNGDLHLPPYFGNVDWMTSMKLLKESGYSGKLSYELHYGHFPEALFPAFMAFTNQIGKYLISLYEKA